MHESGSSLEALQPPRVKRRQARVRRRQARVRLRRAALGRCGAVLWIGTGHCPKISV